MKKFSFQVYKFSDIQKNRKDPKFPWNIETKKFTSEKLCIFKGLEKGLELGYLWGPGAILKTSIKKNSFLQYINVSN